MPQPIRFHHPHDIALKLPPYPIFNPAEEGHLHITKISPVPHKEIVSISPKKYPNVDGTADFIPWLPDVQILIKDPKVDNTAAMTKTELGYLLFGDN